MLLIFIFSIIFNTFYQVKCSCYDFKSFYVLGELNTTIPTKKKCNNDNDICVYMGINIPALSIGKFSGCSEDVNQIFSNIIFLRLDISDLFKQFTNNGTSDIDMKMFCKNSMSENQTSTYNTMSGMMKYYLNCYSQDQDYTPPSKNFDPPKNDAISVECIDVNNKPFQCKEGYCGMFEVAYLEQNGTIQEGFKYGTCPNTLINQLYMLKQQPIISNNSDFSESLYRAGNVCEQKFNLKIISSKNIYSYFWYINCFVPKDGNYPKYPEYPNLKLYLTTKLPPTTTTTQITTTTTKGASKNTFKFCILSFLSLYLLFNF